MINQKVKKITEKIRPTRIGNFPNLRDKHIATGKICGFCTIFFAAEHGHPVVCKHCYPRLKRKDLIKYKLATENFFGE